MYNALGYKLSSVIKWRMFVPIHVLPAVMIRAGARGCCGCAAAAFAEKEDARRDHVAPLLFPLIMDNKLPTTSPTRVAKPSGRRYRVSSWTGVVLLALTVCALRPIRQLFNKPASFAGSQQERIDDPWSTAFPGNDTVGTVQLSPCEGGVECGYIVCVCFPFQR
jgi:hypothetical protein